MAISKDYSITINNSVSEININVISITEDRLENILNAHFVRMSHSRDWIGAAALFLTILIVLVTSDFKNKWLDAPTWRAFFLLLCIASLIYLIYCTYNFFKNKDSVSNILQDIKRTS